MKLTQRLRADIPDGLLREFATEVLKAERCGAQYLEALRIVLGNQAQSYRRRVLLEMNLGVTFSTPRTMRTILDQMDAAGITHRELRVTGAGHVQRIHCYRGRPPLQGPPAEVLERMDRGVEDEADLERRRARAAWDAPAAARQAAIDRHKLAATGIQPGDIIH